MKNIFYFLSPLLLTGCLSAKISHKSEVKTDVVDLRQKQAEAKTDDSKETHIHASRVDTVIVTQQVAGETQVQVIHDTAYLDRHKHDRPISKTISFGKGWIRSTFTPGTGIMDIKADIPPDTIKVQADVTETTISEHKTSDIDSSSSRKNNTKSDVKGQASVAVSLFSMDWMKWVFLAVGLMAGIFIGKKMFKKAA